MKKISKILCIVVALVLIVLCVAACGDKDKDSDNITVTFSYNYEGAAEPYRIETVKKGEAASEPDDPTRANYTFAGWYTTADFIKEFDFEYGLTEDTTVYARWTLSAVNITFDYNYPDASPKTKTETIPVGSKVSRPASPERTDDWLFTDWYKEASCMNEYDFSQSVKSDTTIYAGWEKDTGENVTLTFMWNYDNAPDSGVYDKVTKNKGTDGTKFTSPTPVRVESSDNYKLIDPFYFDGWYTDASCKVGTEFDFEIRHSSNATVYAKWLERNILEAEYADISDVNGSGYSGPGEPIVLDEYSTNASNGYFLTNLYYPGNAVVFDVYSNSNVSDAVIFLRLSGEFYDFTLTDDKFVVQVGEDDDAEMEWLDYDEILIDETISEVGSSIKRPFTNHKISTVSLKEGQNTIKLIINNDDRPGGLISGTMYAVAPMIDCMYIYTNASITMTEHNK